MEDIFKVLQPAVLLSNWASDISAMGLELLIKKISVALVTIGFLAGLGGTATMRLPFLELLKRTLVIALLIGASIPIGTFTKSIWKTLYLAGNTVSDKALDGALKKSGTFGTMLGVIGMAATAGSMVSNGALKASNITELAKAGAANGKNILKWASLLNQLIAPFWFVYLLLTVTSGLIIYVGTLFLPLGLAFCMFHSIGGTSWISGWVRGMVGAMAVIVILPAVFTFALKLGWEAPMNYVNKGLQAKVDSMVATMVDIGRQEAAIVKAIGSLGTDAAANVEAIKATFGGGLLNNGSKMVGIVVETIGLFIGGCFAIVVGLIVGATLLVQTDRLVGATLGGAANGLVKSSLPRLRA